MAINKFFENQPNAYSNEQNLYEDLIYEAIQIRGHNVYYIPRESRDQVDMLFGEDPTSKFENAYEIEMYIKTNRGFEGDQDFLSKFGLETRDNMKFLLAGRAFDRVVPKNLISRPREGDLIYSTLFGKMFEITFVQNDPVFYALGRRTTDRPYFWELACETFKYSHDKIATGIDEIDDIVRKNAYTIKLHMGTGSGGYLIGESVFTGSSLETATAQGIVSDWNPDDKILSITNIKGIFVAGANTTGSLTETTYTISGLNDLDGGGQWNIVDNVILEDESNNTIVTTETNPFNFP
jgi:hypothetical protein